MACGAQAHLAISAVTGLAPKTEVWLFGSEGTLHYTPESLEGGLARRQTNGQAIAVPPDKQGVWRVEEESANAIRGKKVAPTSFEDGVR